MPKTLLFVPPRIFKPSHGPQMSPRICGVATLCRQQQLLTKKQGHSQWSQNLIEVHISLSSIMDFMYPNKNKLFFWDIIRLLMKHPYYHWLPSILPPSRYLCTQQWWSRGLFFQAAKQGSQNLAGCGNFSRACSFYCTACSFYCTADARSDSENLQKFLKKWLFWTYFVLLFQTQSSYIYNNKLFCSL